MRPQLDQGTEGKFIQLPCKVTSFYIYYTIGLGGVDGPSVDWNTAKNPKGFSPSK